MGKLVSVRSFGEACNQKLGTNYTWNSNQLINLEWLCNKVRQVYQDIHRDIKATTHYRFLSTRFSYNYSKFAVDEYLLADIINYLAQLRGVCNCACACTNVNNSNNCCNDCACGNCDCSGVDCTSQCACECACDCRCDCISQTDCICHCECACDCEKYNCNCIIPGNQCTVCPTGDCYNNCCQNCDCRCDCVSLDCCCFPGDVLITLKNGKKIPISEIKKGDFVKTLLGSSKVAGIYTVNRPVFKIAFKDGTYLRCTDDHPIVADDLSIKLLNPENPNDYVVSLVNLLRCGKLKTGDKLFHGQEILDIESCEAEKVYELILEDDHVHYANNVLVLTESRSLSYLFGLFSPSFLEECPVDFKNKIKQLLPLLTDDMRVKLSDLTDKLVKCYLRNILSYRKHTKIFKAFRYSTRLLEKTFKHIATKEKAYKCLNKLLKYKIE